LATALHLAEAGHPVVLGARRLDRLEDAAAKLRADGCEAIALPLDLTSPDSIDAFAERAEAELGPIEVLVSNAGDVLPATALGVEPDDFVRQVQVNVLGAHRLANRLGRAMVDRQRGDIVFVSSDVVRVPRTYMAAYITSKHALEGLARAMQMELEGTGVRVGIVRPGPSSTEQGTTWSHDTVVEVMADWEKWGLLRHAGGLRGQDVARVVHAVVTTPRGTHLTLVEVEPEAPTTPAGGSA
jgi:NAD(P)-dependent dehydrogenase (short-subunit alcohol dehydrogenase family)